MLVLQSIKIYLKKRNKISCYVSFQDPKPNVVRCHNFARPVGNQKL